MTHRFDIRVGLNPHDAEVFMDGKRLEGVTGLDFSGGVKDRLTELRLTLHGEVFIKGEYHAQEMVGLKEWGDSAALARKHAERAALRQAFEDKHCPPTWWDRFIAALRRALEKVGKAMPWGGL